MSQRENERRRFLTASGAGALALAGFAKVEAAEWSDAERANVKTVTDFCAAWATRDLTRVLPFLADDCVYRMTETTPPANGHQGVSARLKTYVEGSDRVQFQVLDTFAAGPIVINHRIDQ